jgi:Domain of unknown function (DUF4263)
VPLAFTRLTVDEDREYASRRNPDRIYFSKEFGLDKSPPERPKRYLTRVLPDGMRSGFVQLDGELVIRETQTGREQIKALFTVDDRNVETLTLQRFGTKFERPYKDSYFSLRGNEIQKLLDAVALIKSARFTSGDQVRIDEADLPGFALTPEAVQELTRRNLDVVVSAIKGDVSARDVFAIAHRKRALDAFKGMLDEAEVPEADWQEFFEANQWILGYGLFYVFTTALDGRKLEQVVAGHSFATSGKRVDALLKTRGLVSSLCFAEIKTHKTLLLESRAYRPESWAISRELSGAIAQAQRAVERAEASAIRQFRLSSPEGDPVDEPLHLFRPRSIVIAGLLSEFTHGETIREGPFASFELFRRQLQAPEIITFDELYERARFITEQAAG